MSQSQQQTQATDILEEEIRVSINYRTLKVLVKNYDVYTNPTKKDPLSILKALCVNPFVNRKIQYLQKIKTISFAKLNLVTAKQSTSVNLKGL